MHLFVAGCFTWNFEPLVQLDSIQLEIVTKQPRLEDVRVSDLCFFSPRFLAFFTFNATLPPLSALISFNAIIGFPRGLP